MKPSLVIGSTLEHCSERTMEQNSENSTISMAKLLRKSNFTIRSLTFRAGQTCNQECYAKVFTLGQGSRGSFIFNYVRVFTNQFLVWF